LLTRGIFENPMATSYGREMLIHEFFHQVQYILQPYGAGLIPLPGIGKSAWDKLVEEQIWNSTGIDVYAPGDLYKTDLSSYNTTSDIPYLESQAQMIGQFGKLYHQARYGGGINTAKERNALIEMNRIILNSGIKSEATKWVSENI